MALTSIFNAEINLEYFEHFTILKMYLILRVHEFTNHKQGRGRKRSVYHE